MSRRIKVADLHEFCNSLASVANFLDRNDDLKLEKIRSTWEEIAGKVLDESSRPLRITGTKLIVAANSPAARTAVTIAANRIAKALVEQGFFITQVQAEFVPMAFKRI